MAGDAGGIKTAAETLAEKQHFPQLRQGVGDGRQGAVERRITAQAVVLDQNPQFLIQRVCRLRGWLVGDWWCGSSVVASRNRV